MKGLVVIMAGSDSNLAHMYKIREKIEKYDIEVKLRICSAHKQASKCQEIINEYNNSERAVVFVTVAGGTDALSGLVSFHSTHPVISCPPDKNYKSCLKNPTGSSNSLILKPTNLAKHCAQILSHVDPDLKTRIIDLNTKKINKLEKADEENI